MIRFRIIISVNSIYHGPGAENFFEYNHSLTLVVLEFFYFHLIVLLITIIHKCLVSMLVAWQSNYCIKVIHQYSDNGEFVKQKNAKVLSLSSTLFPLLLWTKIYVFDRKNQVKAYGWVNCVTRKDILLKFSSAIFS